VIAIGTATSWAIFGGWLLAAILVVAFFWGANERR
jgi:hypothetical protein